MLTGVAQSSTMHGHMCTPRLMTAVDKGCHGAVTVRSTAADSACGRFQ